jgi:hypothetical protein
MAVVSRLRMDPRTRAYAARRLAEGRSKREVMRCLKRYLAREVYRLLVLTPSPANSITADASACGFSSQAVETTD